MLLLRCTAKLRKLGGWPVEDPPDDAIAPHKTWYANLIWIERRKCILLTHASTLYSVFAVDVRKSSLVDVRVFLEDWLFTQLVREGIDLNDAEPVLGVAAGPLVVGPARNRTVLGSMNELAFGYQVQVDMFGGLARVAVSGGLQSLLSARVNSTPMRALDGRPPGDAMRRLLGYPSLLSIRQGD